MLAFFVLVLLALPWQTACGGPCNRYFDTLKQRCRLNSTAEGEKLDRFLALPFRTCQLDICVRANINDIDCSDPDSHIPGGLQGRFLTCE